MAGRMQDKVAVVFGGSGGLGRGGAIAFAQEGAKVVVSDLNAEGSQQVADEIKAAGGEAIAVPGNIAKVEDVRNVYAKAMDTYGKVDAVFCAHGILRPAMLWKMTDEQWDEVIDVHLKGTFYALREIANHFIERKYGHFVAITSPAATTGQIGQINYCAAKGGIIGIVKGGARELARYGVNVNALNPIAATPMTELIRTDEKLRGHFLATIPFGRFAEPAEIAPAIVFLASDDSSYMTGELLNVTGGRTM